LDAAARQNHLRAYKPASGAGVVQRTREKRTRAENIPRSLGDDKLSSTAQRDDIAVVDITTHAQFERQLKHHCAPGNMF
jgi:hypothetical protein